MAVTIDGTLQPNDVEALGTDGSKSQTLSYKGEYASLKASANSLAEGTVLSEGWVVKTWTLTRANAGLGVLQVNCVPEEGKTEEDEPKNIPLKITWSIHSVRNDVNVMAYCGDSVGANPLREQIEQWLKETDGDVAANLSYRAKDGEVVELTNASKQLAAKMAKGVEHVMRFYPELVKKSVYSTPPDVVLENLSYIDTPVTDSPAEKTEIPKGLADKIEAFSWLKVKDDVDQTQDGKWMRVECWWGASAADGGWDENLYGTTNRWSFPADITGVQE